MANFLASASTLYFLKQEEGFRSTAYWDFAQWSIGYGSGTMPNGRPVRQGDTITEVAASKLLEARINNEFGATVNNVIRASINRNQWDALVSLCYNIGISAFSRSTVADRVNANPQDFAGIEAAFKMWNKAGGVVNSVLVARRQREADRYKKSPAGSLFFFVVIAIVIAVGVLRKKTSRKK